MKQEEKTVTASLKEAPVTTRETLEQEVQDFILTHYSEEDREKMNPAWSERLLNKIKTAASSSPDVKDLDRRLVEYLPHQRYLLDFLRDVLVTYCNSRWLALA
jgi:hypothetical protein